MCSRAIARTATPPRRVERGPGTATPGCEEPASGLVFIIFSTSEIASELELSFRINVSLNFKTIKRVYITIPVFCIFNFNALPVHYYKSGQRYWHLRPFLESEERESENDGSFPFAPVSQGGWATPCYVVRSIIHSVYVYVYVDIRHHLYQHIYINILCTEYMFWRSLKCFLWLNFPVSKQIIFSHQLFP